jgi:hypothetical protein
MIRFLVIQAKKEVLRKITYIHPKFKRLLKKIILRKTTKLQHSTSSSVKNSRKRRKLKERSKKI